MLDLQEKIRDRDGNVIRQGKNLACIRRFLCETKSPIKRLAVDRIGDGEWEGMLSILFENGDSYQTRFASFDVLCTFVRNWRNVRGAPLMVNGAKRGIVSRDYP